MVSARAASRLITSQTRPSTAPCTGTGTITTVVRGQRSRTVRSMSARAELGTLVRRAMRAGQAGRGRLRSESKRPSGARRARTSSNRRITAVRLGRTSRIWTERAALAVQKFNLPTTVTPSPSSGTKASLRSWDDQITPGTVASPSVRVSHRCPFLSCGRLAVASSRKRGAKPRPRRVAMASLREATV